MQGYDRPIISKALRAYFLENKDIVDFIKNHGDIYDFCVAKKIDKKFRNELHYIGSNGELTITQLQPSVRYYVSVRGGALWKYDPHEDKYINYCSGKAVKVFNNYRPQSMDEYEIDYNYYISETMKIINLIEDKQLKLF